MSIYTNHWNYYHYFYGDERELMAMISFDESACETENQKGFDELVRVILKADFKNVSDNGIVDSETHQDLVQLEQNILELLQEKNFDCWYVGRMTYGGMRELIFMVNDNIAFRELVGLYISDHGKYEWEGTTSKGWDFFNAKLAPNAFGRQFIFDRQLYETLVEHSNPEKLHYFEHAFVGEKEGLAAIKKELEEESFDVLGFDDDSLRMAKRYSLDLDVINQTSEFMIAMSSHFKCKYDGWGAGTEK